MKSVKLSELLTEEQWKEVNKILEAKDAEKWKRLREYLVTHRDALEKKGVVPEYLAYALEYYITTGHWPKNSNETPE